MKTTVQPILILLITFLFLALLPQMQAVSPAPDGCYPGFTTSDGCNALNFLTTGAGNTGVGWYSLFATATGSYNTGVGAGTLVLNTADSNTAIGAAALLLNTTGTENTAVGTDALVHNDSGQDNTATGAFALFSHTSGNLNTANGAFALFSDTSGEFNTATGWGALFSSTGFGFNTATGANALSSNTTGGDNTATGAQALDHNTIGHDNTADGLNALLRNTTGNNNVALGTFAGDDQTTGSNNVYIGYNMEGTAGESNACYIASIFGQTSVTGVQVLINSDNKLGTMTSSKRFKQDIKPMDKASEALFALKPVSFHYKKEIDPSGTSQLGLVAEEVEKLNPDLIVRDKEGRAYSVRYDQVNAMLLNEFLKEHRKVEKLQTGFAQQQKDFQAVVGYQQKQIDALTAGLQKVSAQLEVGKPAQQTVLNNQ
jgi:hypothetical protein